MRTMTRLMLVAVLVLAARPVTGQVALEFGTDAGVRVGANGTDVDITSFSVPIGSVRFGVHVAPHWSIENSTSFDFTSFENSTDLTLLRTDIAGLYHFGSNRGSLRPYLKAGMSYRFVDFEASDGEFGILGAAGLTWPVAKQIALRFQGGVDSMFDSRNEFSGLVGFSVFTR